MRQSHHIINLASRFKRFGSLEVNKRMKVVFISTQLMLKSLKNLFLVVS